ncbi:RNA-binding (RRM/RBD/RNP motifs) family protein [Striga asiatica]|uniref:RNA-binding (RRM/RBD/RNP motifs) family protein n=1 Tax=Striga asiatica TaxID=4170 RepID=A0A5A7PP18_STRAF|nr:RNA-binding (RRM/RBD/RNP motifs) family protein [Striga asiatica]
MTIGLVHSSNRPLSSSISSYPKPHSSNRPLSSSVGFRISSYAPPFSLKLTLRGHPPLSSLRSTGKNANRLHAAVESVTVEEELEEPTKDDSKKKLFIIKNKDGRNRGYVFVTMASREKAQAAIEKYNTFELVGLIIRVEFSRQFNKPIRNPPRETRYKLYVINLAWKVRPGNLRDIFTPNFNPVSVRIVFGSRSGKSVVYAFVSFATKEEAESAVSLLDGKVAGYY